MIEGGGRSGPAGELRTSVIRELEELGLNRSEASVLVALMQCGSGSATDLARLSDLTRTNVYPAVARLTDLGLAMPVVGRVATWTSPGRDEVLGRLYAAQERRLQVLRSSMDRARDVLGQLLPDMPQAPLPFIRLISDASEYGATYDRLLRQAHSEVLTCTKPPYAAADAINPAIIDLLARIQGPRSMLEVEWYESMEAEGFRRSLETYIRAGLQVRLADRLPMKIGIFDRSVSLVTVTDPGDQANAGYPNALLIEHPDYAAFSAEAFEQLWARARPYPGIAPA